MNPFLTLGNFGHHRIGQLSLYVTTRVWLAAVMMLSPSAFGQQLAYVDAPEPKSMSAAAALPIVVPTKPPVHRFFDRQNMFAFSFAGALRTADSAYTCAVGVGTTVHNADGSVTVSREDMLPTNSCHGVILMNAAFTGIGLGGSYALHKMGWHKLERVPNWIVAAVPAWAIGYTATHQHVISK